MISLYSLLLPLAVLGSPLVKNEKLEQALKMAPVNLDKFDLLKQAGERWTYDFSGVQNYTFSPGSVNKADAYSSPVMIGTGMTMQLISLGPCSMLPPHSHPRADNVAIATHGTTQTWMYNENNAEVISTTLSPLVMTVFPRGSVHGMMNMGCSNAQLVSVLNSEDTGTLNLLNGAAMISDDLVEAVFQGALTNDAWTQLKQKIQPVGTGAQWGVEACYKACGLPYQGTNNTFTFDDASQIWDGQNGLKDGYYDAQSGKTKPNATAPYSDGGDAGNVPQSYTPARKA